MPPAFVRDAGGGGLSCTNLARHVDPAAMDWRIELPGLAYGGIAAPPAVPKDAVAFRRSSSAVVHRRMPTGYARAHGFHAKVFDRIETEHRICLHEVLVMVSLYHNGDLVHLGESEPEGWLGTTHSVDFVAQVEVAALLFKPCQKFASVFRLLFMHTCSRR